MAYGFRISLLDPSRVLRAYRQLALCDQPDTRLSRVDAIKIAHARHPLILIGAPTAFQPECPTVM
jgi:hypothetical protein